MYKLYNILTTFYLKLNYAIGTILLFKQHFFVIYILSLKNKNCILYSIYIIEIRGRKLLYYYEFEFSVLVLIYFNFIF